MPKALRLEEAERREEPPPLSARATIGRAQTELSERPIASWSPVFKDSPPKSWVWANLEHRTGTRSLFLGDTHTRQDRCPLVSSRLSRYFTRKPPFSSVPLLFLVTIIPQRCRLFSHPLAALTRLLDSFTRTVFLLSCRCLPRKLIPTIVRLFTRFSRVPDLSSTCLPQPFYVYV